MARRFLILSAVISSQHDLASFDWLALISAQLAQQVKLCAWLPILEAIGCNEAIDGRKAEIDFSPVSPSKHPRGRPALAGLIG